MGIGTARPLAGADIDWSRWYRPVCVGLTALAAAAFVAVFLAVDTGQASRGEIGWDLGLYRRIAERWLATGSAYWPEQLTGPYPNAGDINLYPPLTLPWFAAWTVLPTILWWIIPLGAIGWALTWLRPAPWTWPILVGLAASVPFVSGIVNGNSGMWSLAIVFLSTRWPWLAPLLALKPSDFLFALPFAWDRRWWLVSAMLGVVSLAFGALWIDWITASLNKEGPTLLYGLNGWPLMLAPIVLRWLHARRPAR